MCHLETTLVSEESKQVNFADGPLSKWHILPSQIRDEASSYGFNPMHVSESYLPIIKIVKKVISL
jgi:hypothetical protein